MTEIAVKTDDQESAPPVRGKRATPLTAVDPNRPDRSESLEDPRFCALLGASAWSCLPENVRARFGKRLAGGSTATYAGQIAEARRTWCGWLLAQGCRAIGAPLPLRDEIGVSAVVTVTEDLRTGGQFWTRIYGRRRSFPQVIHSSKRFAGPTGLEEYLGYGFGIALTVSADRRALHFHSDHYFLSFGGLRLRLPRWLDPGALTISHVEGDRGTFLFVLTLRHPLFGEIIHQTGVFRERHAATIEESKL